MCARTLLLTIREGIFTAGDIYCLIPRSPLPSSLIHNCSTPISNDDFVTPVTIALMGCALSRVAAGVRSFMTEFPSHTDIESEKSQRKEDKIVKFLPVFPLAIIPFLRRDPILRAQACFMGGGGGAALTSWDAGCYQAQ